MRGTQASIQMHELVFQQKCSRFTGALLQNMRKWASQ